MDPTLIFALIVAAVVGLIAILLINARLRRAAAAERRESPYSTSTEGQKRCPACGMGNLWTEKTCVSCGASLPG